MEATASKAKLLFMETRPQFLILTPAVFSIGIAAAVFKGYFNALHLILALIGSLFAHITVNVINDYYDFKRGTDQMTQRTPFSGGSGLLPEGLLKPNEVLALGLVSLVIAASIGVYFSLIYPILMPIVLIALVIAYGYTPFLTRIYITELFPGLGFGPLLVIGAYITQLNPANASISLDIFLISLPSWFLVSNLLWVNEIPDYEADIATGRNHMVKYLGKRFAAIGYVVILVLAYASIIIPAVLKITPALTLLGLITVPVAIKAAQGALKNYNDTEKLVPTLGQNVLVTIATPLLMAVGLIISKFI